MVKKFIIASLPVIMMTACSNEELIDDVAAANEIAFDVNADGVSRSVRLYSNPDRSHGFYVSARHGESTYIFEDYVETGETGAWVNRRSMRYWPEQGDLDFYAYVYDEEINDEMPPMFEMNSREARLNMFTVADEAPRQVDLLYASAENRTSADGSVPIHFSHALAQVVFRAANSSGNLNVELSGVKISNIKMSGDFIYPTVAGRAGKWDTSEAYPRTAGSRADFDAMLLDSEPRFVGNGIDGMMLLLPQTSTDATDPNGLFPVTFVFKCVVRDGDRVLVGDKKADGSVTPGEIRIPSNINWREGNRYTYTLNFGAGSAATTAGVLLPVSLALQVTDFKVNL